MLEYSYNDIKDFIEKKTIPFILGSFEDIRQKIDNPETSGKYISFQAEEGDYRYLRRDFIQEYGEVNFLFRLVKLGIYGKLSQDKYLFIAEY